MNAEQFDRIAARFGEARLSRRNALARGGAGLAGVAGATMHFGSLHAQDGTPTAGDELPNSVLLGAAQEPSEFLFVQSFASGSLVPVNGQNGAFTLTLDGANPQTVYFSDRPERVFGLATTAAFLAGLGFTPENPPNAALMVTTEDGAEDVLVIELLDPVWDESAGSLRYTVQVLADYAESGRAVAALQQSDYELAANFGPGGLFVDGCADGRIYCHQRNKDGSMGPLVGPSPMTPFCFDYSTSKCLPCSGANAICAAAYPAQCLDRTTIPPHSRCGARGITWP